MPRGVRHRIRIAGELLGVDDVRHGGAVHRCFDNYFLRGRGDGLLRVVDGHQRAKILARVEVRRVDRVPDEGVSKFSELTRFQFEVQIM